MWETGMGQCLDISGTKYSSIEVRISLSEHFRNVNLEFRSEHCRAN